LNRQDLEDIATMRRSISSFFGPLFARQDTYRYQIRLPAPPMLFTTRVTGIEGEPGSLAPARLWAQCEITADCFGLDPTGRPTPFILGESGQAGMLLASWVGADLLHEGLHHYRMLDFDTTWLGLAPKVGDTISLEVRLERLARMGGMHLFFFSVDARVGDRPLFRGRSSAGLFSEADLARPEPVKWSASQDARTPEGLFQLPDGYTAARSFSREAVHAFRHGRMADCFGRGFQRGRTHVLTPRCATAERFLLDEVPAFEPDGGPWGRGYLRATQIVSPDDWYFAVHLPGDPHWR
jgi:hypothetical protein